jgi:hypothetical protein
LPCSSFASLSLSLFRSRLSREGDVRCAALLFLCRCSGWPDVCILVCLGGGIEEAHSCEVVRCLAVGQYAKQAEEIS